jgi:hypothetical protein
MIPTTADEELSLLPVFEVLGSIYQMTISTCFATLAFGTLMATTTTTRPSGRAGMQTDLI